MAIGDSVTSACGTESSRTMLSHRGLSPKSARKKEVDHSATASSDYLFDFCSRATTATVELFQRNIISSNLQVCLHHGPCHLLSYRERGIGTCFPRQTFSLLRIKRTSIMRGARLQKHIISSIKFHVDASIGPPSFNDRPASLLP